jgi:methanogenic corrinoid protein MtbC1
MGNLKYDQLAAALDKGKAEPSVEEAVKLIESGATPIQIFSECIEPVLEEVGKKFTRLEIFLPEMVLSAAAVKAVQKALIPYLKDDEKNTTKGKIVLATVTGDLHDIGKNIVKAMLEVSGFDIKDLGVDVSMMNIVKEAKDYNADIIALSALMVPSLPFIKDTIELSKTGKNVDYDFKIMIGGGPVTEEWADKHGAAYGNDASDAVTVAKTLRNID